MSNTGEYGYILRVSKNEWIDQMFRLSKYYTGLIRAYTRGQVILFLGKVDKLGDCFIGYGVIDKVEMLWEMPPEEEDYARGHGWKVGLTFRGLTRLDPPVSREATSLNRAADPRTGAFIHGARIAQETVDAVLDELDTGGEYTEYLRDGGKMTFHNWKDQTRELEAKKKAESQTA